MPTYYYMYATCKISKFEISLLEISYIPLPSVMKLNYHRLYQISSLEANLSLEDLKQLFREKPPQQVF